MRVDSTGAGPISLVDLSRAHRVPAVAIVGVVLAEQSLNVTVGDRIEDALLEAKLAGHPPVWWDNWALSAEKTSTQSAAGRAVANKWPPSLVLSGYVVSFGPAQLTPRTALLACAARGRGAIACTGGVRQVVANILTKDSATELVAVVLDQEAAQWEGWTGTSPRADVGMLGTLYSRGSEFLITRRRNERPNSAVGRWVAENCARIALQFRLDATVCAED